MPNEGERIYDSPPSDPEADFWLGQGEKMVEASLPATREAAKALMTGLGVLKGIYVAILGFGETAKNLSPAGMLCAALPLVAWMVALYLCLCVMMTQEYEIHLLSPDSIRKNHCQVLEAKQRNLWYAFLALAIGLVLAMAVIALGPHLATKG